MTKPPTCTYDTERGWCTPEHLRDCKAADCRGCRPCAEDHCELNGRCAEHVEHEAGIYTCPRCILTVRKNVRRYWPFDVDGILRISASTSVVRFSCSCLESNDTLPIGT